MHTAPVETSSQVRVLSEANERWQVSLDKLFGLQGRTELATDPKGLRRVIQGSSFPPDIRPFENLREAYVTLSGDLDIQRFGRRALQMYDSFTFANALANTMNSLLAKAYGAVDYRWREIVTSVSAPQNFKTQERVRIDFISDLEEVPEDDNYEEVSDHADEKFTFSVGTWGKLLMVTRRALLANNVGGIERAVEQLGRAAARTLAKRIWQKLIANHAYGVDGLAMFHTGHGNLGATALSVATLNAARLAMFAQTEPGSDERLGLGSGPLMLAVPIELEATAREINGCQYIPGSVTYEGNPFYQRFGAGGERIFANPLFVDSSDWFLFDVSGRVGILEVGFLMGRQMPEVIVEQDPLRGSTFSQDRICYKLRHEYECAVEDYRGSFKAVVA